MKVLKSDSGRQPITSATADGWSAVSAAPASATAAMARRRAGRSIVWG